MGKADNIKTARVVVHFHRERAPIIGMLSAEAADPVVKDESANEIHLRTIYAISIPRNSRYDLNKIGTMLLKHEVIVNRANRIL